MNGRAVAANELTVPSWDFISKQPIFKVSLSPSRRRTVADVGYRLPVSSSPRLQAESPKSCLAKVPPLPHSRSLPTRRHRPRTTTLHEKGISRVSGHNSVA